MDVLTLSPVDLEHEQVDWVVDLDLFDTTLTSPSASWVSDAEANFELGDASELQDGRISQHQPQRNLTSAAASQLKMASDSGEDFGGILDSALQDPDDAVASSSPSSQRLSHLMHPFGQTPQQFPMYPDSHHHRQLQLLQQQPPPLQSLQPLQLQQLQQPQQPQSQHLSEGLQQYQQVPSHTHQNQAVNSAWPYLSARGETAVAPCVVPPTAPPVAPPATSQSPAASKSSSSSCAAPTPSLEVAHNAKVALDSLVAPSSAGRASRSSSSLRQAPLPLQRTIPTKPNAQKQRRRYTAPKSSRYCHLCARHERSVRMVPCGNVSLGLCQKSVCSKCISTYNLAPNPPPTNWSCPHCLNQCPERAKCFAYDRQTARRREKTLEAKRQPSSSPGDR